MPRAYLSADPFIARNTGSHWRDRANWPARWIHHPEQPAAPFVAAYKLFVHLPTATRVRMHVSADERYHLFVDGELIGRGPERGAPQPWFFETFDLDLPAGLHVIVARVWALGPLSPQAQMSVRPGFLLAAEGDLAEQLTTGIAPWQVKLLDGYTHVPPPAAFWKGSTVDIDGVRFPWGFEYGFGDGWVDAAAGPHAVGALIDWELSPRHVLAPATLPPMIERRFNGGGVVHVARADGDVAALENQPIALANALPANDWQRWYQHDEALIIPPHTSRRVLIDLNAYVCAYPALTVSGGAGALVRIFWAEALLLKPNRWSGGKGHRAETEGRYFLGAGDLFRPDGGAKRRFDTLWWSCGRYVEVVVQTHDAPLTLHALKLVETRYPLESEARFESSDTRLSALKPILERGIQATAHETYCDGPYWEEMMYLGDTRIESLCTSIMTRDTRLQRKALRIFDASRFASGFTHARFPTRVPQLIAPFSLWWIGMLRDFAYWRESDVVRALLPGARQTMHAYERYLVGDVLHAPEGWNNFDWVPEWDADAGIPPSGIDGVSALLNWQYVRGLVEYADVERGFGEVELAKRAERMAHAIAARCDALFWDDARGLFANDATHTTFSEHVQCMAVLSGLLDSQKTQRIRAALLADQDMHRATIYFSHYLFEAFRALGCIDALFERLSLWHELVALDLKTPVESPKPRSDCHGWGAHPLYHLFASVCGIRPASLDFSTVEIAPQLGPLQFVKATLPHPRGEITVDLQRDGDALRGEITLPDGVTGVFVHGADQRIALSGRVAITPPRR
jgi:alpha-L-rhamnosidase